MIVTEILKYGYAISALDNEDKYEKVQGMRAFLLSRVKKSYKRSHRVTAAFGALSHLKEVSNDEMRDLVLMLDTSYLTFKYKMKTTPLLLKLDRLVEWIECKIISIKSKLFTLQYKYSIMYNRMIFKKKGE